MRPKGLPAGVLLAVLGLAGACRPTGDVEVKDITFTGVTAFPEADLKNVLATQESGRFFWSAKHYFDRPSFDADLQRIHAYYVDRGYPAQRVTNIDVAFNDDRTQVRVRVDVDEGAPVVVESVRFEGFGAIGSWCGRRAIWPRACCATTAIPWGSWTRASGRVRSPAASS